MSRSLEELTSGQLLCFESNERSETVPHVKRMHTSNWRTQFEEHPGTGLATAFGRGIILSALLRSPRRSRKSYNCEAISAGERKYLAPSYEAPSPATPSKPSELRKSVEALTVALLGVAANQASSFLDSVLPGFHQEFTKARAGKNSGRHNSPHETSPYSATDDSTTQKPLTAAARA
jgi:hypothetical protein